MHMQVRNIFFHSSDHSSTWPNRFKGEYGAEHSFVESDRVNASTTPLDSYHAVVSLPPGTKVRRLPTTPSGRSQHNDVVMEQ